MWCAVAASGIRKVADASDRTDVCGCTCTYTSILYSCDVSSLFPVDEDEDELNLASWLSFGRQIILFFLLLLGFYILSSCTGARGFLLGDVSFCIRQVDDKRHGVGYKYFVVALELSSSDCHVCFAASSPQGRGLRSGPPIAQGD